MRNKQDILRISTRIHITCIPCRTPPPAGTLERGKGDQTNQSPISNLQSPITSKLQPRSKSSKRQYLSQSQTSNPAHAKASPPDTPRSPPNQETYQPLPPFPTRQPRSRHPPSDTLPSAPASKDSRTPADPSTPRHKPPEKSPTVELYSAGTGAGGT